MNWVDVVFIVFLIIFIAVGARMGSVWAIACMVGGFLGSYLVDTYALSLTAIMGSFVGARVLSVMVLYLGGFLVAAIPGWVLSKLTAAVLGLVDSLLGLIAGALCGFVLIAVTLLYVLPLFPSIERTPAWKKSKIIRPFDEYLEDHLIHKHLRIGKIPLAKEAAKAGETIADAVHDIKTKTTDVVEKLEKKK